MAFWNTELGVPHKSACAPVELPRKIDATPWRPTCFIFAQ